MAELREGRQEPHVERITVRGIDGFEVEAIHARPEGMPRSGIVLHPDLMGVRPLFDDLCRRLATHGFAVCAPEPFARAPADVRDAEDSAARMAYLPKLDDDVQLGDLEQAADRLVIADDVSEVAVVGFCMGGMQTLKAAATGRFDRAVPFYGMIRLPENWRGGGLREPLDTAADVCPTLAIFGSVDPFTPAADIDALRAAWQGRTDCEIVVYDGADHGFVHAPERPVHRPADAADAWNRVLRFLGVEPELGL
ncbi:MAG TPA: dienelactone hydrolase family protein [Acidimicrobiia bacterium]|nr:dienelactone hydrolase family protein [Acidimicrobiia bacterium]